MMTVSHLLADKMIDTRGQSRGNSQWGLEVTFILTWKGSDETIAISSCSFAATRGSKSAGES